MSVSYTNNKQIVEVAEKYVSEQICPLLPNASISEYSPYPMHKQCKGESKSSEFDNGEREILTGDTKQSDAASGVQSLSEFKNRIIVHRLIQSDIHALKKANTEQGFLCGLGECQIR